MSLFDPITLGNHNLPNRIIMAPLTRARCGQEGVPKAMAAEYYRQRSSVGLIIGEATHISPQGYGWVDAPGIYTREQMTGWQQVTDAVHDAGGKIFCQLWHMGAISHPSMQPDGQLPVSSSAVKPLGEWRTYDGKQEFATPRPLTTEEVAGVVADYRQAAVNAKSVGFDGVELLAAGRYLPTQFFNAGINQRTDKYGGSAQNRVRFVAEVIEALVDVWGGGNVGIKVSHGLNFDFPIDPDPGETCFALIEALNPYHIAYLHCMEQVTMPVDEQMVDLVSPVDHQQVKNQFNGAYLANGNYDGQSAVKKVDAGLADGIVFGRLMIANPDLPARLQSGSELNAADPETFYGGDERGYTDYPSLA